MSGKRYDQGKNRLDLLSFCALWQVGAVGTRGSVKYADRNWEGGMCYSRTLGCALRHIFKWAVGHKYDEESGLHHMAHAAWNIMALLHFEMNYDQYKEFDDIPDTRTNVPNESCPGSDSTETGKAEALGRIKMEVFGLVADGYLDEDSIVRLMDAVEAAL